MSPVGIVLALALAAADVAGAGAFALLEGATFAGLVPSAPSDGEPECCAEAAGGTLAAIGSALRAPGLRLGDGATELAALGSWQATSNAPSNSALSSKKQDRPTRTALVYTAHQTRAKKCAASRFAPARPSPTPAGLPS